MGRYHFRDDNEVDHNRPDYNHWHLSHHGGREAGENINDKSFCDEMGDGDKNNSASSQHDNHGHDGRVSEDKGPDREVRIETRFLSHLPWRKNSNESTSPSYEASFRRERFRESDYASEERRHVEVNEECQSVASTKDDRECNQKDSYPIRIHRNNYETHHESTTNKNPSTENNMYDDEYDSHNEHRSVSSGTLRSYSYQSVSDRPPEVHYHIYVSEEQASRWLSNEGLPQLPEDESSDRNRKRTTVLWKWITMLAALTQLMVFSCFRNDLIARAPLTSYLTWEDYRRYQFRLVRNLLREGRSLLENIGRPTLHRITGRGTLLNNDPRYTFPDSWTTFVVPNTDNFLYNDRRTVVYGQDAALKHLQNGLNIWSSTRMTHRQRNQIKGYQNYPLSDLQHQQTLVIHVSGGKGIGKKLLPYLLLEQLQPFDTSLGSATKSILSECVAATEATIDEDIFEESKSHDYYCPLLHITPSDYDVSTTNMTESQGPFGNSSLSFLYQKILDHVIAADGGASIVAMENVDIKMGCDPETKSCVNLWLSHLMAEVMSQRAIFGNTIFILTSQIGTDTVERWTRKRLHNLHGEIEIDTKAALPVANAEVEALLRHELKSYYLEKIIGIEFDDVTDTSIGIDDWLLVPMAPLDRNAISAILENLAIRGLTYSSNDSKMSKSYYDGHGVAGTSLTRSLFLTQQASNRILDAIEWHQWIHKTSGTVLRFWSPDGAIPLLDLWEKQVLDAISSS